MEPAAADKKAAILVNDYFEQSEFEEPLRMLSDTGAEVTVVTTKTDKQLHSLNHADPGEGFTADALIGEVQAFDYDLLVLPGGVLNADKLRMDPTARNWASEFMGDNKPLAVICHAPWLLVSADLVDGRRLTSWATLQDDIENAGGEWLNQDLVVDGNLITSRGPDDLTVFCDAIRNALVNPDQIHTMSQGGASPRDYPTSEEKAVEDDARLRSMGYDKQRDQLDAADQRDILAEEDESDPDQLRPSRSVTGDEQDGSRS